MKKRIAAYVSTALITLTAASASATLLLYDGFDYTATELLAPTDGSAGQYNAAADDNWYYAGAGGANNNPPGIANAGLNLTDVTAAGYGSLPATTGNSVLYDSTQLAAARFQVGSGGVSPITYYYSGLFKVNALNNMTVNANGLFFASFNNGVGAGGLPGTGTAVARMRVDGTDNSKFNLGVAKTTGTGAGNPQFSGTLNVGETYFFVASYEIIDGTQNDIARMWINPSVGDFGSEPGALLTSNPSGVNDFDVLSIALRNVNTVPTGGPGADFQLDELRVGTTWADVMPVIPEPGAAGLLGLGMLLLGWRRLRTC